MYLSINKFASLLLVLLINNSVFSQIQVGEWRDHLPYRNGQVIACSEQRVYCATEMALFYYDKTDGYIQKLSKINMLSDLEPGYIAYSKEQEKLIIGYLNGNIDVIHDDTKYNYPDIKIKDIIADKNINHINIHNNQAYLATGFGIVVFNLEKDEFADSYIIGAGGSYMNINNTIVFNNFLYALTNNGIYKGDLDDPFLGNYQNWEKVDSLPDPNGIYSSSAVFDNKLILVNKSNDTDTCKVISYQNEKWDTISSTMQRVKNISTNNNQLLIPHANAIEIYEINFSGQSQININYSNHGLIDGDNVWVAHYSLALLHYQQGNYKKTIRPNGPRTKNAFKIYNNNGVIQVAPGGYKKTGAGTYYPADVFKFENEKWNMLTDVDENKDILSSSIKFNVSDFASQNLSTEYIANAYYNGLFKVKDNLITELYNRKTTGGILGDTIGGITYDNYGNLHAVSMFSKKPFVVKTPDNKWYSYNYNDLWPTNMYNGTVKLINTYSNNKWVISRRNQGIFVYNDNRTPENGSDDTFSKFKLKDQANSIISDVLSDIVQDVEGTVWIATSDGVAVYDYPENALRDDADFYARRPQIVVDGYLHGLLEGEYVSCIAVDGANRKWLGTEGAGLFLVSADGTEQIISWNVDNSKLLSNTIYSIDINQKTGEVFIGTDKGLQSYKSTSSENKSNYSSIYTFPNPVKGDYNGLITVRGLMYQTDVKITDISGNKVYETISNGGDAIWNGKDLSGNDVAPGIYLVMCTLPDGSEAEVSKILIVK